ncbi:hypothetical protein SAMN04487867_104118 [Vreelandella titanicae]|uniref:hypothetical protein n=1 Tax=Vreelandella titanicae TaxID=664683 RepID=UPI00088CC12E|nr:hypothetical protein [Halomonas titanicae]SDI28999.1 hypothetical protein SAMN04487867_104118 [Halomonas titanicae]
MKQRERFEAWAKSKNYILAESKISGDGMTYRYSTTEAAWRGYQAACPEDYQAVPKKITAETGHKYALMGEFSESVKITCPECWDEDEADVDCEICYGHGEFTQRVPIEWDTIKCIHDRIVSVSLAPKPPC